MTRNRRSVALTPVSHELAATVGFALHEGSGSVARRPSQHAVQVAYSRRRTPLYESQQYGAISAIRHRGVAPESDLPEYDQYGGQTAYTTIGDCPWLRG